MCIATRMRWSKASPITIILHPHRDEFPLNIEKNHFNNISYHRSDPRTSFHTTFCNIFPNSYFFLRHTCWTPVKQSNLHLCLIEEEEEVHPLWWRGRKFCHTTALLKFLAALQGRTGHHSTKPVCGEMRAFPVGSEGWRYTAIGVTEREMLRW